MAECLHENVAPIGICEDGQPPGYVCTDCYQSVPAPVEEPQ